MPSPLPSVGDLNWATPLNNYIYEQIPIVINSIDELQNLDISNIPVTHVQVLGYYEPGDGGGGLFRLDNTSNTPEDSGMNFLVNQGNSNGRWARLTSYNELNVRWFGAKGDRSTDDVEAFEKTFNYARNNFNDQEKLGIEIYIPPGRYRLSRRVTAIFENGGKYRGVTIKGAGMRTTSILTTDTNDDGLLRIICNHRVLVTVEDISFVATATRPDNTNPPLYQGTALEIASINAPAEAEQGSVSGQTWEYPGEDYFGLVPGGRRSFGDPSARSAVIRNVTIGGANFSNNTSSNNNSDGYWRKGISLKYTWFPMIENCHILRNFSADINDNSHAIELVSVYQPIITKSVTKGAWNYGIHLLGIQGGHESGGNYSFTGESVEDGYVNECFIVGCKIGIRVQHIELDDFLGPEPLFTEPGWGIFKCHINCYLYGIQISNQRQIKIANNHMYSANRTSNYDPTFQYSSIIRLEKVADAIISSNIFGGPGYFNDDSDSTRSIWIKDKQAQHIFITGNQFNAGGVAIFNESNVTYDYINNDENGPNISHIIVSNNMYGGRSSGSTGHIGQSFGPQTRYIDQNNVMVIQDNDTYSPPDLFPV